MNKAFGGSGFSRLNIFTIIGLLLALATPILMILQYGVPGIFTLLLGGLFLLIGANDKAD